MEDKLRFQTTIDIHIFVKKETETVDEAFSRWNNETINETFSHLSI